MSEVTCDFGFDLSCRCARCQWSMPLDELKAKGGTHQRMVRDGRTSIHEVRALKGACPRCGGDLFRVKFTM